MKKIFYTLTFLLISSVTFANADEIKEESSKELTTKPVEKEEGNAVQQWRYTCSDGTVVFFECGCNVDQATAMGRAWCNNR